MAALIQGFETCPRQLEDERIVAASAGSLQQKLRRRGPRTDSLQLVAKRGIGVPHLEIGELLEILDGIEVHEGPPRGVRRGQGPQFGLGPAKDEHVDEPRLSGHQREDARPSGALPRADGEGFVDQVPRTHAESIRPVRERCQSADL